MKAWAAEHRPVTSTASDASRISSDTLLGPVTRDVTLVPTSARAIASSGVKRPDTPAEVISAIAASVTTMVTPEMRSISASEVVTAMLTPEMRSISASTARSGPDGMSKRI